MAVQRALLSVFDKTGIVDFARALKGMGIELISTGGTAKLLKENNLPVREVSSLTGFPEMMDGRVKTLHPKIHGGILAKRSNEEHMEQAKRQGIELIDLVVVNLYPFKQTVLKENASLEEIIENIDIGGPALIRAAAKNFEDVTVVVNPQKYSQVLSEIKSRGEVSEKTRAALSAEAFEHTAFYDSLIAEYLGKRFVSDKGFPSTLAIGLEKLMDLRYGENPHQKAALYARVFEKGLVGAKQLQGKELSYNNILDADSALALVKEFQEPACVIVKHNNPCGVGVGERLLSAFEKAFSTDPEAAFGGVIAFNKECAAETAKKISETFFEVVLAPSFSSDAVQAFSEKKNLRVLDARDSFGSDQNNFSFRSVSGGALVQENDEALYASFNVVSKRQPTEQETKALLFAWKVAKHVRSNAVVYAAEDRTVGIGAGQMKRVDCLKLVRQHAGEKTRGCVLASDAFFPFRDSIDLAAQHGITAIIQPGGSLRDAEVIAAANSHGMAMVFTGTRHFKH